MQDESGKLHPEREIIELPPQSADARQRSAWAQAILGLALVVIGASATYVMYFRSASSAAGAVATGDPSAAGQADAAQLSDFLIHGQSQLPAMRAALGQAGGFLHAFAEYPQRLQVPLNRLRCNPFRQPPLKTLASYGATTGSSAVDLQHRQEAERAAMLQAVEAMQLQSISASDTHRSCMINDVLYDEGGTIKGFTIEQINPQSVVVRNGLYRFELTMNH